MTIICAFTNSLFSFSFTHQNWVVRMPSIYKIYVIKSHKTSSALEWLKVVEFNEKHRVFLFLRWRLDVERSRNIRQPATVATSRFTCQVDTQIAESYRRQLSRVHAFKNIILKAIISCDFLVMSVKDSAKSWPLLIGKQQLSDVAHVVGEFVEMSAGMLVILNWQIQPNKPIEMVLKFSKKWCVVFLFQGISVEYRIHMTNGADNDIMFVEFSADEFCKENIFLTFFQLKTDSLLYKFPLAPLSHSNFTRYKRTCFLCEKIFSWTFTRAQVIAVLL